MHKYIMLSIKIAINFLFLIFTHQNYSADSSSLVQVALITPSRTRIIPSTLDCSCELIVFPVDSETFNIRICGFPIQSKVILSLEIYNNTFTIYSKVETCVYQIINTTTYKTTSSEITQKITISEFRNITVQNGSMEIKIGQDQNRKVYLILKQQLEKQYKYRVTLPETAMGITQLLAFILMVLLCSNIKYRRFTPFKFGFPFAIFYSLFLIATVYIEAVIEDDLQITFWVIMLFSLFCMTLYFVDLTSIFLDNTKIIIAFSFIVASTILIVDIFLFPNAWFVNNLIAIFVAGALIKFVVIKKLKAAVFPLCFLWLFFILRQFAIDFRLENFMQAMRIKIIPLFLQIPAILNDNPDGYICSAFGTSKIITMGLMLNYAVRVDLFLSSNFYKIVVIMISALCMGMQILISIFFDELPVMEYISVIVFLPIAFILLLLLSSKRGQWAQIWHGSFHDMAVDRTSVRKQGQQIDEQFITKQLENLKLNPSVSSQ